MKKIFISFAIAILFLGAVSSSNAQVLNNFQDGNWLYYYNLCWGIGPNSSYYGTNVVGQGTFNGSDVCETDNLGQTASCVLTSPWVRMNGNGNITFTHAIRSFDGTRSLKVYLISYPSLSEELLWTYNYSNATVFTNTVPYTGKDGNFKVKWEWNGSGGNSRGQIDNISIDGQYNSDPSMSCQPLPDPIVDTDQDGVADENDQFPTDPHRAFQNFYPAIDTGTLVFEDLWPSYGDYDLNDMVVGYTYKVISNANQNIVEIYATFVLRASGASLNNGFGFQLPGITPSSVISVTGANIAGSSSYSVASNGTENGQNYATVIVFDRSRRLLPHSNTVPGESSSPAVTLPIYVKLMENGVPGPGGAVSNLDFSISDINPFLVSNDDRGKEVHLPGFAPTSLANPAYFGTGDDDTKPSQGKYYQSKTNLPWALDINYTFEYPIEKIPANEAYLHFNEWVQSNGSQYPDWYMDKPGYRDASKIY